jgi:hypothetical protein
MKNKNALLALSTIASPRSLVEFRARPALSNSAPRSRQLAITFGPAPKTEKVLDSAVEVSRIECFLEIRGWFLGTAPASPLGHQRIGRSLNDNFKGQK